MAWFILDYIFAILAIIGMAAILCAIILFVLLTRNGDVPDDEWHRLEDEEQVQYLKKWREKHEKENRRA